MGMEEEDENLKKTYMVEDNGSDHATWMVEGSKMNGSAATIGFPRPTRWDKEKESKSHKETTQILESNLTFNFNIQLSTYVYKSKAPLYIGIEDRSWKVRYMKSHF